MQPNQPALNTRVLIGVGILIATLAGIGVLIVSRQSNQQTSQSEHKGHTMVSPTPPPFIPQTLDTRLKAFQDDIVAIDSSLTLPPEAPADTTGSASMPESVIERQMKLQFLIEKAQFEGDSRIAEYTMLSTRAALLTSIGTSQKAKIQAELKGWLDQLTAVKGRLQKATSYEEVLRDQTIITQSYKPYAFYVTKVRILSAADNAIKLEQEMKIRTPSKEVLRELTGVKSSAVEIVSSTGSLTLEQFPQNRAQMRSARATLGDILADLQKARNYVK